MRHRYAAPHDLRRELRGAVDRDGSAIVARAASARDVQTAVLAAWEHDLELTVRSTGHGTLLPPDRGLVLDTAPMREVLIDPDRRIARVGAGAVWGDVIAAAAPFGLAPPSGSHASVGVAGFTLGGGVGWLARKHGYAADSMLRAQVVTADGRLITAARDRNADLFWALRGGGGNFGIVTSLEIGLYPVDRVYGGQALYPIDRAADVLRRFRDWAPDAPRELTARIALLPAERRLAVRAVHLGGRTEAERALRPLLRAAGDPLHSDFRPMTYAETESIPGTPPRGFELLDDLTHDAIESLVTTTAAAVEIRHWGGATADPGAGAGPVGHRAVPFSVAVDGAPADVAPIAAHATGGSFLNFLHDTTATERAYAPDDLDLLRHLKRVYDPENLFGRIHNIAPAATQDRLDDAGALAGAA